MSFNGCSERFANAPACARRAWFNASRACGRSLWRTSVFTIPAMVRAVVSSTLMKSDSELGMKSPQSFVSFKPFVHQLLIPHCPHL